MQSPEEAQPASAETKHFPCQQCGAKLVFSPGLAALKCEYCGFENPVPQSDEDVRELDFRAYLAAAAASEDTVEAAVLKCQACGAEVTRPERATALECPFCGSDLIAAEASRQLIRPKALLPFKVAREAAGSAFDRWLAGLWFAPSGLRQRASKEGRITGMYVPYWTYDCDTVSRYTGERGDDYWATETYTTIENGRSVTKTRQVRRTRWRSVSGVVSERFDDVLVVASKSLPQKHVERLTPWDLPALVPYSDEYLAGFRAESYQVDLAEGFATAKDIMDEAIRASICADIGGDHQRIHSVRTQYNRITFKHILLPVWISAYRFRDRVFRFLVNARTGEVQGERPWSWAKIVGLVVIGLGVIGAVAYLFANR